MAMSDVARYKVISGFLLGIVLFYALKEIAPLSGSLSLPEGNNQAAPPNVHFKPLEQQSKLSTESHKLEKAAQPPPLPHHEDAGFAKSVAITTSDYTLYPYSSNFVCPTHTNLEFHSQIGQDEVLFKKFFSNPNKCQRVFLDVGANDGLTISNSLFFENDLDWRGFCVEANPSLWDKLSTNRPKCRLIRGGAGNSAEPMKYVKVSGYAEMLSGWLEGMSEAHLRRIDEEVAHHGGSKEVVMVQSYPLRDIFKQANVAHIDFFSLDIEGAELMVLESIDFSQVTFGVFAIEVSENQVTEQKIHNLLQSNGYRKDQQLGSDAIYVRQ